MIVLFKHYIQQCLVYKREEHIQLSGYIYCSLIPHLLMHHQFKMKQHRCTEQQMFLSNYKPLARH